MSEREREMALLREILSRDPTAESRQVEGEINRLQGQIRVLHRAVFFMVVLVALACVGLGYAAILSWDYPDNMWRFSRHVGVRVPCALGLASGACLLCFMGLGVVYRRQLNRQRENARRLARRLLASPGGAGPGGEQLDVLHNASQSSLEPPNGNWRGIDSTATPCPPG
jgi:hypothetical protein